MEMNFSGKFVVKWDVQEENIFRQTYVTKTILKLRIPCSSPMVQVQSKKIL